MLKKKTIAAAVLLVAPLLAYAQQPQQATYRCTGNDGKKYYGSTIPMQCVGRPIEQMNKHSVGCLRCCRRLPD